MKKLEIGNIWKGKDRFSRTSERYQPSDSESYISLKQVTYNKSVCVCVCIKLQNVRFVQVVRKVITHNRVMVGLTDFSAARKARKMASIVSGLRKTTKSTNEESICGEAVILEWGWNRHSNRMRKFVINRLSLKGSLED